jgi:hypothetical protein
MKKLETTEDAIHHLTKLVNWTEASVKQKRLDLNMVSASDREFYEKALSIVTEAIKNGELTKDVFYHKVGLA